MVDSVTPDGKFTQFSIANLSPNGGSPYGITLAHDGNLAFGNVSNDSGIGEITTSGVVTVTPIPKTAQVPEPSPADMATAPDGSVWWIDFLNNWRSVSSLRGGCSFVPLPTPNALNNAAGFGGNQINVGPDGNIWFAEGGACQDRSDHAGWRAERVPSAIDSNRRWGRRWAGREPLVFRLWRRQNRRDVNRRNDRR